MGDGKGLPTVMGLLIEGCDPSAALVHEGRIVAFAEEERFNRDKHAMGVFPSQAIAYCLEVAQLAITDVDVIAVGWDAAKFPDQMADFYKTTRRLHAPCSDFVVRWQDRNVNRYTPEVLTGQIVDHLLSGVPDETWPKIRFVNHHYAHACSSFFVSGFERAAILTADGHGEDDCTHFWVAENGKIRHLREWLLPLSLGWFYTKFTQFFGFHAHDGEGKLMGLAAYGKPVDTLLANVRKVLHATGDERIYDLASRFFYGEFEASGPYTREWIELFGEPRPLESREPFNEYYKDLAFAVQHVFEEACLALAKQILAETGMDKLCVAGGTFMNCKMNGQLAKTVGFKNFFAQPAAGDNGVSLGAALAVVGEAGGRPTEPLLHTYFGPSYNNDEIEAALKASGVDYRKSTDIAAEAAALLADSKVVGWFQGSMEAGARAMGNRSILANPLNPEMSNLVNNKVKFRESWRPFCPSVLVEDGPDCFDYSGDLPFMIVACEAREGVKDRLPSVVHVDNTVRVQSVRRETNPLFYALIEAFKRRTGVGVVLNTSFNVKGEPIVLRPAEAISCFEKTGMDAMAIG
ncbi:MAG: nodulation protein, partial [Lysobacterales bacterium]